MISSQAFALLRNLSYGQDDLESLFDTSIDSILQSIEAALRARSHLKVIMGALDVLCNLAASMVTHAHQSGVHVPDEPDI